MKKTLIIIASILAPLALHAEPGEEKAKEGKGPRPGRQIPAELLAKYDTDGDGKISGEERKAIRKELKARHEGMIAKFDTDGDGKLNPEERKAAVTARFDADGDGVLNEEEQAKADAARRPRGERGKGGPRGEGKKGKKGGKAEGKKGKKAEAKEAQSAE